MSKKDFQNGFALGLVSGGVETTTEDVEGLKQLIEEATGESYNDLTEAVQGSIDRYNNKPWYDFVIELTSDVVNGKELLDAITPYLADMRINKGIAIFTLLNSNIVAGTSNPTSPVSWGVIQKTSNTAFSGRMAVYRYTYGFIGLNDMTNGYGCTVPAGTQYYIKVVKVLE